MPSGGVFASPLRAVDVTAAAGLLGWASLERGVHVQSLPTRPIELSTGTDEVAVASWRWDIDADGHSRNVAVMLRHALDTGIDALLVDAVTIDQTLPTHQLVAHVAEFAELYGRLPVLCAYDHAQSPADLGYTVKRPWILSECRIFSQHANRVTYLGWRTDHTVGERLTFANHLHLARQRGYADAILAIARGDVGMSDVADFALILWPLNEHLSHAHAVLTQADYLVFTFLAAARLERSQTVVRQGVQRDFGFRTGYGSMVFHELGLTRFTVSSLRSTGPHDAEREVLFDGVPVAVLRSRETTSFDRNWVAVLPTGIDHILQALGMDRDAVERARQAEPELRSVLTIDPSAPRPRVTQRCADFANQAWTTPDTSSWPWSLGFDDRAWAADPV